MNNTYFNRDIFPNKLYHEADTQMTSIIGHTVLEESYMDGLIRKNIGNQVCIYVTFPNSDDFRDFKFKGILEYSGKDYVILSEPSTGKWHLIPSFYIDFITFDENINYSSNN